MIKDPLILKRNKHIINIYSPFSSNKVRYDLKEQRMEKYNKKLKRWVGVEHQYTFFRPFTINSIETTDEKFKYLIAKSRKLNPNCRSVSTFISRLSSALIYENYIEQGIETECLVYGGYRNGYRTILRKPLSFYDKNVIKFFKKFNIKVTQKIEYTFSSQFGFLTKIVTQIFNLELESSDKKRIFEDLISYRGKLDDLQILLNEFKYDFKSLMNYIFNYLKPFENIDFSESLTLLKDYYSMAHRIGRDVKKYPKYLKSIHDIILANYNSFKQEYDEELFSKLMKKELIYEGKEYSVLIPKTTKDIISEGTSLNHCVSSYVERILKKKIYIFFLRKTEEPEKSLITLELKDDQISQAKGSYNRILNEEEIVFLKEYCKNKKIKLGVKI